MGVNRTHDYGDWDESQENISFFSGGLA
jgi:hypothetical protein